jgi:glycosyltransferase involved in cell wall biosynthesis
VTPLIDHSRDVPIEVCIAISTRMSVPLSIVIATRSRLSEVFVALESCLAQEYPDFEVLVYDDASTDGTADAIRKQFPEVRLFASAQARGYLVWRNHGFREARGDFVVSLDDDAYFTDAHTLSRLAQLIDTHPAAGAFALPFAEPRRSTRHASALPLPVGTQLRSFTGCAHAVRRELAVHLGGYPEFLEHQGEERHFCLRLLDAGFATLMADTPPIMHLVSPHRDRIRLDYYGYRNTLLFTGMLAPAEYVLPRLVFDSAQLLKHRFAWTAVPRRLHAILCGWGAIWKYRSERCPATRQAYSRFRGLPGHGPVVLSSVPPPVKRQSSRCTKY